MIYPNPVSSRLKAEVTVADFSLGTKNTATNFEVVIGNGMLQKAFISETNNLSAAEGTFGEISSWNDRRFYGQVGVIGFTRTAFRFFPTGKPAPQVGDKITVPEGATIIVDGYTVVFGETFEVWYNGETWQMEYVEAPQQPDEPVGATKMTLTALDLTRSVYTSGMYQLYFTVDVINNGATWAGWDNSANVVLNGVATKADGWCFASESILYVQLTADAMANPLTIAKGTKLTINNTDYEIENDYNVYYYDGEWHTEAKAEPQEVTISGFSFGSKNNQERIDIVIGSGTLQTAIATCESNLSTGEGTFGTLSTWNNHAFPSIVGVLPKGANGFMFFPSGGTPAIGDKITVPEGATIIVNGYTAIFGETLELWYNGESWQMEEVEPLPPAVTEVTISEIAYLASNVEYKTLNFSSTNGSTVYKWSSTTALYNGAEINVSIVWETAEMFQVGTGKDWAEGDIFTLKAGASFEQGGITYTFEKDYSVYYYDGEWHTEAKAEPQGTTISAFTLGTKNSGNQIDIVIGNGTLPESFAAAGDLRADAAFTAAAQWNDQSFAGKVGVLGNGNTFNFFPPSGQAKLGDKITVAQGTTITIGEDVVTFGEKLELWFNGTSWQMTEPVIVSGFTFGENNKAGYFDIVPTSGSIPAEIVSSGTNLSTAEGTFGKSSTWTRDGGATTVKFPGQVGVLASAAQNFQIFPSGATAAAGDVITIPEGATIMVNGYSVVFGETLTVTFNGTTWEGLGAEQPDPATMLTITRFSSSRTVYKDGVSQIYVYTDITNNGATWGGWDNKSNVSLSGTETRADWCFANTGENALLYVQVQMADAANTITLKKGTILTINNTRYEIAEDFNLYYYDGAFHAEPQA